MLRVQVNIPAESGDMGVLANHVPSIEQLKPGLVEIVEESGGSKQFFCKHARDNPKIRRWMETCVSAKGIRELRGCRKCINMYDLGSVWRVCHCAARLSAQHQRRGRVSLARLQFRRKSSQGFDLSYTMLISSSSQAVRSQITEAQKIAGGNGSEQDIAEAKIELEVR